MNQHKPTKQADSLKTRVETSLHRHGLHVIAATDLGDRTIELSGLIDSVNDFAFAVAIARTVPGVARVVYRRERN